MVTINGIEYTDAQFRDGGHIEVITAGTGAELPRWEALMADILADASRARSTTSATSKDPALTGSQSWVLAEDLSFAVGSYATIASRSTPTAYYVGQVTGYNSGTSTLTVTVLAAAGAGGPYTDWDVMLSGKPGSSGEAGAQPAPYTLDNFSLSATVNANALTVALKDRAGSDPGAASPVNVAFRNPTAATGDFGVLSVTAALSLTVSSGSTLGTANGTPFRLWVVLFDDGGTARLGVVNCLSGTNIFPLRDDRLASSTAEGGAGAADSAHVIYTGTAVTSKALRVLGYLEYGSGLATAGTYASAPTKVQLFGPGVALPGEVVQTAVNQTGAAATGTTTIPIDDTIPQNTEGTEFMTQAITPTAAANVLDVRAVGNFASSANVNVIAALFQDSAADALAAGSHIVPAANNSIQVAVPHRMRAGTTAATTFKLRAGTNGASTVTFNGWNGSRALGGVYSSTLRIDEIMA